MTTQEEAQGGDLCVPTSGAMDGGAREYAQGCASERKEPHKRLLVLDLLIINEGDGYEHIFKLNENSADS